MTFRFPLSHWSPRGAWSRGGLVVLVLLLWVLLTLFTLRFLEGERMRLGQPQAPDVTIPELPVEELRAAAARVLASPPPPPVPPSPTPSPAAVLE